LTARSRAVYPTAVGQFCHRVTGQLCRTAAGKFSANYRAGLPARVCQLTAGLFYSHQAGSFYQPASDGELQTSSRGKFLEPAASGDFHSQELGGLAEPGTRRLCRESTRMALHTQQSGFCRASCRAALENGENFIHSILNPRVSLPISKKGGGENLMSTGGWHVLRPRTFMEQLTLISPKY